MPNDSESVRVRRARLLLVDFEKALLRLGEALAQPENEFIRDAAIQRFEFSFELAWKSVQAAARLEGQDCASPRVAFSTAWRNGWIDDEAVWLDMLDARNKTTHTYREAVAREVFAGLPGHLPALRSLHRSLSTRLHEIEAQHLKPSGRKAP
jgi:nucleotidyltransferase substrate binding protein (TIGR01987 family)